MRERWSLVVPTKPARNHFGNKLLNLISRWSSPPIWKVSDGINWESIRWSTAFPQVVSWLWENCSSKIGKIRSHSCFDRSAQYHRKIGIKEEVVPGSVSVGKLGNGKGALPFLLRHIILLAIGIKYYRIRTSMVQDLDAGRKTEIDELNGQIVTKSKNGESLLR